MLVPIRAVTIHVDTDAIHALGHTAAAELAALGCSDELIMSANGHSSARMVAHFTQAPRGSAPAPPKPNPGAGTERGQKTNLEAPVKTASDFSCNHAVNVLKENG
ncbi:hypothetical protein JI664_01645 [Rhodobacter sp. NTK016B]|uniref:hypothetical protein n=1 Tax=Rhodobacter sp. NTK016B TaxID=2759676 RepID=UPI001A8EAE20|nr:hypothetical protein [Rhodobacter sp. NTK016B]MBN8290657.1 hypothetical protein [Rhodobacter sp. NTK016B]